ncbi:hypothetical protein R3P38DRAFT_3190037 [Favolaschia claudopus]|uniref:Uncharacterized protein n=1 Tax=Favolaschia claudopus TaxID=2862362 RepID=A0AAW0BQF4_9AGAR
MVPEQCRLILVPIRSYHSSHGVLPHTILSFPFISRFTLGSYGSRTSPVNPPALLVDAPACTATRPAGAMRTSSWSSSVHPNTPTESSRIPIYVPIHPRSPGFSWKSSDLVITFIQLLLLFSYAHDTYSAETLDEAHPRFIRIHFHLPPIHSCSSSSSPHVRLAHPAIRPARLPRPGR